MKSICKLIFGYLKGAMVHLITKMSGLPLNKIQTEMKDYLRKRYRGYFEKFFDEKEWSVCEDLTRNVLGLTGKLIDNYKFRKGYSFEIEKQIREELSKHAEWLSRPADKQEFGLIEKEIVDRLEAIKEIICK